MGIEVYNQQNAISSDPYVLILKLYEGLLKYLSFAEEAMQNGDIEEKFIYINKSIAIFDELRNVLDFDVHIYSASNVYVFCHLSLYRNRRLEHFFLCIRHGLGQLGLA